MLDSSFFLTVLHVEATDSLQRRYVRITAIRQLKLLLLVLGWQEPSKD
jgi:hypothetical protein